MTTFARLMEHIRRMASRLRVARATASGVQVGKGCAIGPGCDLLLGHANARRGAVKLGDYTRLDRGTILHPYGGRIETGTHVYVGPYTIIYGHGSVVIGQDTLISMHCRILSSNHALPPPGTGIRSQNDVLKPTRIGADVWLGAGVTVLGGVTVGDGCVVGAGAVVAADLPNNTVAMGIPARVVRSRS